MGLWAHIKEEWATVSVAPVSFIGLLVLGLGTGFFAGHSWRGQEVANHQSRADSVQTENAALRSELERLRSTPVAAEPAPHASESDQLTSEEIEQLRGLLSRKPSFIEVTGLPRSTWAQEVTNLFSRSGWKVEKSLPVFASNEDVVTLKWTDAADTGTITEAFDKAGIRYDLIQADGSHLMTLLAREAP